MTRALPILAVLLAGCASSFGVQVTFDEEADARAATTVEVSLVSACPADPSSEPVAPVARATATRGGAMALPSVPAGRYGLVGRAWSDGCEVVAAGCQEVDLSSGARTLVVALHHQASARCAAPSACSATTGACAALDGGGDSGRSDGGSDTGLDAPIDAPIDAPVDAGNDSGTDAGPACPPLASRPLMEVTADITSDTTWDCEHLWSLHTEISVRNASSSTLTTLTIEPGTVVVAGPGVAGHFGALLVARTARLVAAGTPTLPITFTSDQPVGMRHAGDWGGISVAGRAAINRTGAGALPTATYPAATFGPFSGTMPENEWDCGRLTYVRIEFAGATVPAGYSGLAGLTMGACGTGTIVHHLEVHRTLDDGVAAYGGRVDFSHVLISGSEEDSLDWSNGWDGRVQFFVIWQWPVSAGADTTSNHAIEADSELDTAGLPRMPRSHPRVYNATIACAMDVTDPCVSLRTATEGLFGNTILSMPDTNDDALDICDDLTAAAATSGALDLEASVITDRFGLSGVSACLSTFDERAWACAQATCDATLGLTFDYAAPDFDPGATLRGRCGATPTELADGRPPFFDTSATYCGAMSTTDWIAGWTEFPRN